MSVSTEECYNKYMTKQCTKCKKTKSVSSFFTDKSKSDGLYPSCRECSNKVKREYIKNNKEKEKSRLKKWRLENPEKALALHRRYVDNNRELLRDKGREYYKLNSDTRKSYQRESYKKEPEKIKARVAVYQAIKSGKLVKPEICDLCNRKDMLEAHHNDYSKKLEIDWLCRPCHGLAHRKAGVSFQSAQI